MVGIFDIVVISHDSQDPFYNNTDLLVKNSLIN